MGSRRLGGCFLRFIAGERRNGDDGGGGGREEAGGGVPVSTGETPVVPVFSTDETPVVPVGRGSTDETSVVPVERAVAVTTAPVAAENRPRARSSFQNRARRRVRAARRPARSVAKSAGGTASFSASMSAWSNSSIGILLSKWFGELSGENGARVVEAALDGSERQGERGRDLVEL